MTLLKDLIISDFGKAEDYNCAEKILYGANKAYDLGLSVESLKLSAGFGGGMGIESSCGALTAGVMVLSHLNVDKIAHEGTLIKEKSSEFLNSFIKEMNSINCYKLKEIYRDDEKQCDDIIIKAAELLDEICAIEI
ncbi:MAG: C-GCAxxG-C-C family protein [Spirochaetaceae bacterium]